MRKGGKSIYPFSVTADLREWLRQLPRIPSGNQFIHLGSMPTLSDFLNTPRDVELEGKTWKLRQPVLDEEAMFQRWLEAEAYRAIEKRSYRSEGQREEDLDSLDEAVRAGAYEYSGELALQAMGQVKGVARMVAIICRDQGMTEAIARKMVEKRFRDIEAILASKVLKADEIVLSASPPSPRTDFLIWLCNPPFHHSILELKQLTWDQLLLLFDVERTPDGSAKIAPPSPGKRLTTEGMFRRRCYLLGITNQDTVADLWLKEKARLEEIASKDPRRRRHNRGPRKLPK
jgi:hypothetical protein